MRLGILLLLSSLMALLAMMGEAVPVETADGTAAAVAAEGVEGAEHDLDTAEHLLEIIEKKIFKLLKKCYKLGGCQYDDYGYGGHGYGYGHGSSGGYGGYAPTYYY